MASFWDEFKNVFKTETQKEQERQQKLKEALEKESTVVDWMKQLENRLNAGKKDEYEAPNLDELFPKDSGLKEVEYSPATDEELNSQANSEIDYKKQADAGKIESKTESELNKLNEKGDSAADEFDKTGKKLDETYGGLLQKAADKGIKNGVARGSIVLEQAGDLNSAKQSDIAAAQNAYNSVLSDINTEIESLAKNKDNALNELDLKYAAELEKRISDLKDERASTVLQYEKFNNSVREKNIAYAKNRETEIAKFLKQQEKEKLEKEAAIKQHEAMYGYSGEKLNNYNDRYNIALDFYMSLSPDIAAQALEASPSMKHYLGNNYNKLKETLTNRGSGTKKYY